MSDAEKISFYRELEERVQIAEAEVNRLKDLHATAKKRFDAAVEELRSQIRRDSDQMELDLRGAVSGTGSVEVIGESHQLPGHDEAPTLPENPPLSDPDEDAEDETEERPNAA